MNSHSPDGQNMRLVSYKVGLSCLVVTESQITPKITFKSTSDVVCRMWLLGNTIGGNLSSWKDVVPLVAGKQVGNITVVRHSMLLPKHPVRGHKTQRTFYRAQYDNTCEETLLWVDDTFTNKPKVSDGEEGCENQTTSVLHLLWNIPVLGAPSWLLSFKRGILFQWKMQYLVVGAGGLGLENKARKEEWLLTKLIFQFTMCFLWCLVSSSSLGTAIGLMTPWLF